MKKNLILSHIIRIIFFILFIFGLHYYRQDKLSIELYRNAFVFFVIIHFIFSSSVYKKLFNDVKFKRLKYTLYYYIQILLILVPFHYLSSENMSFEYLWTYFFTILLITSVNDHFEFNLFEKLYIKKEKPTKNNQIIVLKNYLIISTVKSIFAFLFIPNLIRFFFELNFDRFNVLFFYLFFSYLSIFFIKLYFILSDYSENSLKEGFIISIIHLILLFITSNYIIKTESSFRYIYGLIVSSVIILIITCIWSSYSKFKLKFHYKYFWKILVVFLAYYNFKSYFTYESLTTEMIVRIIYFISIFLSVYLCQCYTFEEEKKVALHIKNKGMNLLKVGTDFI